MALDEIIKSLTEFCPYWPIVVSGIALTAAGILGISLRNKYKSANETSFKKMRENNATFVETKTKETQEEKKEENKAEDYPFRDISDVIFKGGDATIRGTILEFYKTGEGYSGLINDTKMTFPFYFSEDNINTYYGEGLVPILLNNSMKTNTPVEMQVGLDLDEDNPLLDVHSLKYYLNGKAYKI